MAMAAKSDQLEDAGSPGAPAPPPPDPVYTLRPFAGEVMIVKYANFGKKQAVMAGTSTGYLGVWDLLLKRQFWHKQFDKGVVAVEECSLDSLLVQCRGGHLGVWNVDTGVEVLAHETQYGGFCKFSMLPKSFSNDMHLMLADNEFGKINMYNCSTGKCETTLIAENPQERGMCMCVKCFESSTCSQTYVLAGFEDGSIALWDCRNVRQELSSLKLFSDPVMCLDFDVEGSKGVCGSPQDTLEVFKLTEQDCLQKSYSIPLRNSGVSDVKVRSDHKIIASGGWDGRIRVFGWKKGKPLAALNYHTAAVQSISFSSLHDHSNLLICGSKDQRVSLWKLY